MPPWLAAYWFHTMRRLTPIHTRMHVLTMRRRGVARPANGCLLKHTDKCARCERFIQVLCTVDAHVGGSVQRRNHRAVLARQRLTCWSSSSFLLVVVSLLCSDKAGGMTVLPVASATESDCCA